jgi:hypothetical protein
VIAASWAAESAGLLVAYAALLAGGAVAMWALVLIVGPQVEAQRRARAAARRQAAFDAAIEDTVPLATGVDR